MGISRRIGFPIRQYPNLNVTDNLKNSGQDVRFQTSFRWRPVVVGHAPKSIMVAVIDQSHHSILSEAFWGRIFPRKIASSYFQFYPRCSRLFSNWKDSTSDGVCRWPVIVIFLIVVANIRLPRKPVQYGGVSPPAMINVRVCFLTQCCRGSELSEKIMPSVLWRITLGF